MPETPAVDSRRRIGTTVIAILFALLAVEAWVQVVRALVGDRDLPLVMIWQFLTGAAAAMAAVGAWRLRPWSHRAVVLYGVLTAALIVALGPILNLDPSGRRGLLSGALVVLLGCTAAAWLLRRSVVTS
ncbi:MAG TPA: hypothetical protein VM764_07885 [Gemmatimonadaceae bacterium]|jgi:peptidoglycan/LPS O-acetylase OafA/YrhL|nr:hypothetical protein [Gemmatimonadaceae bacterium]